jgi:hypothetical protein
MLRDNYLFKTASPLKMEQIGRPETSITNYQSRLRKIPEEARSHLHRSWSMKLRKFLITFSWHLTCGNTWSCPVLLSSTVNSHSFCYQTWRILRRKSHKPKKNLGRKTNSEPKSWKNFSRSIQENGVNTLNAELNPICYLLALLGAQHFLHVSRVRVNNISRGVRAKPTPSDWLKLGMPLLRELICSQESRRSFWKCP